MLHPGRINVKDLVRTTPTGAQDLLVSLSVREERCRRRGCWFFFFPFSPLGTKGCQCVECVGWVRRSSSWHLFFQPIRAPNPSQSFVWQRGGQGSATTRTTQVKVGEEPRMWNAYLFLHSFSKTTHRNILFCTLLQPVASTWTKTHTPMTRFSDPRRTMTRRMT